MKTKGAASLSHQTLVSSFHVTPTSPPKKAETCMSTRTHYLLSLHSSHPPANTHRHLVHHRPPFGACLLGVNLMRVFLFLSQLWCLSPSPPELPDHLERQHIIGLPGCQPRATETYDSFHLITVPAWLAAGAADLVDICAKSFMSQNSAVMSTISN